MLTVILFSILFALLMKGLDISAEYSPAHREDHHIKSCRAFNIPIKEKR